MNKKKHSLIKSVLFFTLSLIVFIYCLSGFKVKEVTNTGDSGNFINGSVLSELRAKAITDAKTNGEEEYKFEIDNAYAPLPIAFAPNAKLAQTDILKNGASVNIPKDGEAPAPPPSASETDLLNDLGTNPENIDGVKPNAIPSPEASRIQTGQVKASEDLSNKSEVKILPNSPSYFFKVLWQTIKGWFVWGDKKAAYQLKIANERLLEAAQMLTDKNIKGVEKSLISYTKINRKLKAEDFDKNQEAFLENLRLLQQITGNAKDISTQVLDEAYRATIKIPQPTQN